MASADPEAASQHWTKLDVGKPVAAIVGVFMVIGCFLIISSELERRESLNGIYAGVAIGGIGFTLLMYGFKGPPLSEKVKSLGRLRGKSLDAIVAVIGNPNARTYDGGKAKLEWSTRHYCIVLIFDDDVCESVYHESFGLRRD